ncbi:ATP-dependent RNA helicase Prh1 [Fistulina hepatica ATCC 64428]|uniref:RNA helicase n=1 Tax=Fistulina hepatica ATCC 64428 TaxID=1128425 RepID=A0A0D7APW3_9AGAR|nr:ATP-dependent RNA helicase Prh1 [Fistulina hepatica ATCC 64428]
MIATISLTPSPRHDNPLFKKKFRRQDDERPNKRLKTNVQDASSSQSAVSDSAGSSKASQNSKRNKKKIPSGIAEQRRDLPITKGKDRIIEHIREHDVTILIGETGSGKTTQVPQYLLESGIGGAIAITQPRRVAATSLAARVSTEQGTPLGTRVGYSVRFDECSDPRPGVTRIKYVTDGMLVREMMSDPTLGKYNVIIIDEAHERTLRTDLLLARLKDAMRQRNDVVRDAKGKHKEGSGPLKVVVMSATLDAEKFSLYFNKAPIVYVAGRQHPVQIYHAKQPQADYVEAATRVFWQVHNTYTKEGGDVLIFLPGQEDIESAEKELRHFAKLLPDSAMQVFVLPMYASLPPSSQRPIFAPAPPHTRKCILATNIAETSLTIPGVRFVIDTGKCKEKRFMVAGGAAGAAAGGGGGVDTLLTRDITQSSALQRAGRAGREGPGYCFRLYTEDAFRAMPAAPEPEILRCSLTSGLLQLKCLGQDLQELDLIDMPSVDAVHAALKTLWLLGALSSTQELTRTGHQMAMFPLEPTYARAILASCEFGCTREVLDIVSVLSASAKLLVDVSDQRESIVEERAKFRSLSGDHVTMLNIMRAYEEVCASADAEGSTKGAGKAARKEWCRKHFLNERALIEARNIRAQLTQTCERLKIDPQASVFSKSASTSDIVTDEAEDKIVKALAHGLAQNSAFLQPDGTYKQTMGRSTVKIHPSSVLCGKKVPAVVYDELVFTSQVYARNVSSIPKAFFATLGALNQQRS